MAPVIVGGAIVWWLLARNAKPAPGTGDVELGVPTVKGSGSDELGDQGYFSARDVRADEELEDEGESEIDRLIRVSNAAIAADDADQETPYE